MISAIKSASTAATLGKSQVLLLRVTQRSFIEAMGLKTPLKDQDIEARVDPSNKTYGYYNREGIVFDQMDRLVIYDSVPHALKSRTSATLRTMLSTSFFYMAYLAYTGNPMFTGGQEVPINTLYSLASIGALFGFSAIQKVIKRQ